MHLVQKKLVEAYATLVMGNRLDILDVPERQKIGATDYPIRSEVEYEIARRIIAAIG